MKNKKNKIIKSIILTSMVSSVLVGSSILATNISTTSNKDQNNINNKQDESIIKKSNANSKASTVNVTPNQISVKYNSDDFSLLIGDDKKFRYKNDWKDPNENAKIIEILKERLKNKTVLEKLFGPLPDNCSSQFEKLISQDGNIIQIKLRLDGYTNTNGDIGVIDGTINVELLTEFTLPVINNDIKTKIEQTKIFPSDNDIKQIASDAIEKMQYLPNKVYEKLEANASLEDLIIINRGYIVKDSNDADKNGNLTTDIGWLKFNIKELYRYSSWGECQFEGGSYSCAESKQFKQEINATGNIKKLIPSVVINNPMNYVDEINQFIINSKDILFSMLPNDALITLDSSTPFELSSTNSDNELMVNVIISKWYNIDAIGNNQKKQIKIKGLNYFEGQKNTTLKIDKISYNSRLFENIFSDDKGFQADWPSSSFNGKAKILKDYINTNIDLFFSNTSISPEPKTQVKDLVLSYAPNINELKPIIKANFSYNGYQNKEYKENINGEILLELRPNPNIEGHNEILKGFQKVLVNHVNANHQAPDYKTIKSLAVDYLNKYDNLSNLPDSWIPSSGSFNDTNIEVELIQINDGWQKNNSLIELNGHSIAFRNKQNQLVYFILSDITIPTTYIKKEVINATDLGLGNMFVDEVINDVGNARQDVKDAINNNINSIFDNVKTESTLDKFLFSQNDDQATPSLNVSFILKDAYGPHNLVDRDCNIVITNFNSNDAMNTSINLPNRLSPGDELFTTLFNDSKGFYIDFKENVAYIKNHITQLLKDPNNNYINNPIENVTYNSINVEIDTNVRDRATVIIKFKGRFNGVVNDSFHNYIIDVSLRNEPIVELKTKITNVIQESIDSNNNLWPSINIVKENIINVLNEWKNDIPNAWIPLDNRFDYEDINIEMQSDLQNSPDGSIKIDAITIYGRSSNYQPTINDIQVKAFKTRNKKTKISTVNSNIDDYSPGDVINNFNNDKNNEQVVEIKGFIQSNINANYFYDLVDPSPTVTSITNIETVTSDKYSLKVSFTLSSSYDVTEMVTDKEFNFILTNFNRTNINVTTSKNNTITYDSTEFTEIFGNDKGFYIDWKNIIKQDPLNNIYTNKLQKWMNDNPDKVLYHPTKTPNIEIKEVSISSNPIVMKYEFKGINEQNTLYTGKGTFSIKLKNVDEAYLKSLIQNTITNEINKNDHLLPSQDTLENALVQEFNKPENLVNVPSLTIPNGNKFTQGDIIVNIPSNINDSLDGNIVLNNVIIGNGSNNPLTFSDIKLSTHKTQAKNFSVANSSIESYSPDEIVRNFKLYGKGATQIIEVKNFINDNLNNIFSPLPNKDPLEIIDINNITSSENSDYSIVINATLSWSYNVTEYANGKQFSFELTNFLNTSIPSDSIDQEINAETNPEKFNTIFNFSPYVQDWQEASTQEINNLKQRLLNYINNNIDEFIVNPITNPGVNLINFPKNPSVIINTTFIIDYSYYGLNDKNKLVEKHGKITVVLKDAMQNPEIINVIAGISSVVQDYVNKEKAFEMDNNDNFYTRMKQSVAKYLNENKLVFPKIWIPDINSDNPFNDNNVMIDTSLIDVLNAPDSVTFKSGAIFTSKSGKSISDKAISSLEFNVDLSETNLTRLSVRKLSVKDSKLSDYIAANVISSWNNDSARNKIRDVIEEFLMEKQKNEQFIANWNQISKIFQINNVEKLDSLKLSVNITIKNATTIFGINDYTFNIELIDFLDNSGPNQEDTKLKYREIDSNESLNVIKEIFGNNEKAFGIDWMSYTIDKLALLSDSMTRYLNSNISTYFSNPVKDLIPIISIYPKQNQNNDGYIKDDGVNYSIVFQTEYHAIMGNDIGINREGLRIYLRSFDDYGSGLFDDLDDFLIGEPISNDPKFVESDIKTAIKKYLNKNVENIPDLYIPETGYFDESDIDVQNQQGIKFVDDKLIVEDATIKIAAANGFSFYVPQISTAISLNNSSKVVDTKNDAQAVAIIASSCVGGIILFSIIIILISRMVRKHNRYSVFFRNDNNGF